ncbi:hypothetical protein [Pseudoalteromonas xiamenensis]|uniref:Uncharacterized protein n=1 Tax=Pseudoalteromonas xiamenensis TaxID=882626 RepID=A0A975DHY7_9GAMM|nr:hypothetical protein [Pseudoalteromonas xiamenensis]QTH72178.1 hypothetical protein J5O05_04645 [Pseudoalteromonas xiamenensis]
MDYLKNLLFSTSFFLVILYSQQIQAAEREDLYAEAKTAYEAQNYVVALKNFYAFYIVNQDAIYALPAFKESLEKKIAECEAKLTLALASNKLIDMSNGKFVIRTNEVSTDFSGTGKEIQQILHSNTGVLERMLDKRKGHPQNQ